MLLKDSGAIDLYIVYRTALAIGIVNAREQQKMLVIYVMKAIQNILKCSDKWDIMAVCIVNSERISACYMRCVWRTSYYSRGRFCTVYLLLYLFLLRIILNY